MADSLQLITSIYSDVRQLMSMAF